MTELFKLSQRNDEPLDTDIIECKRIVTEGKKDARDLVDEITQAHDQLYLQHLQGQFKHLQEVIRAHEIVLSPHRRLSNEILREIFRLHCERSDLGADTDLEQHHSLDVRQPAWCLAQVCRFWRLSIIHEMPALWTTVTLLVDAKYANRAYLLHLLLQRSKGRPLDVHVRLGSETGEDLAYNSFMRLFYGSSPRWRLLHVEGWAELLYNWDTNGLADRMPSLEILSHHIHSPTKPGLSKFALFQSCPRLENIRMFGWSTGEHMDMTKVKTLHWSQNKTSLLSYYKITDILSVCGSLQSLSLDCVYSVDAPSPASMDLITLPQLQHLNLKAYSIFDSEDEMIQTEAERLLEILYLPALTSLIITGDATGPESLIDCLQLSQFPVRSVALPFESYSMAILALVLSVVHFCVTGIPDITSVPTLLPPAGTCPYLETAEFALSEQEGINDEEGGLDQLASLLDGQRIVTEGLPLFKTLRIRCLGRERLYKKMRERLERAFRRKPSGRDPCFGAC